MCGLIYSKRKLRATKHQLTSLISLLQLVMLILPNALQEYFYYPSMGPCHLQWPWQYGKSLEIVQLLFHCALLWRNCSKTQPLSCPSCNEDNHCFDVAHDMPKSIKRKAIIKYRRLQLLEKNPHNSEVIKWSKYLNSIINSECS